MFFFRSQDDLRWEPSACRSRPHKDTTARENKASAMVWDPQQYLKFSGHRLRPAVDLLMRVPDFAVRSVADLGAGAGMSASF
jgi:hypothetical protein